MDTKSAKERKERVEKGRVFLRGKTWWIAYYADGAERRESSGSDREAAAERLLRKRLAAKDAGQPVVPKVERLSFDTLAAMLEADYQANDRVSLDTVKRSLKHLRASLGSARVADITRDRVDAYIAARLEDEAARATVRKEVAALSRMLSLAVRAGKLATVPRFTRLKVENTRTESFTDAQLEAMLRVLMHGALATAKDPKVEKQPDLVPPIVFSGWTGWRMRSDVFTLQWSQVDFEAGTVTRWSRGTSKAGRHVVFPFAAVPALAALLHEQRERTSALERETARIIPHVFHRDGKVIRDFYTAWRGACRRAGAAGRIPHDLRRTAARRLRTLGMSDRDIAEICGWDTVEMVSRYLGRDPAGVAERLRLKMAEADTRARAGFRQGA